MLDIKILRQEPERIKEALKKRNNDLDIEPAIELDKQRRAILTEVEQKKAKQNEISKQIVQLIKCNDVAYHHITSCSSFTAVLRQKPYCASSKQ